MTYATYPSLADRTVVVTGGASGLGAEFVEQFAAQGACVAFLDIDDDAANELVAAVSATGATAPRYWHCDVRDVAALQDVMREIITNLGPIDVLVNNAANDHRHDVFDVDVADWDDGLAVNLRHQFFAAQAAARTMRVAGRGSIVNLGSITAHIDLVNLPTYIASKAAIEGLTRTLARELGVHGIRVNCVIPGWIMTEKQLRERVDPDAEAHIARSQSVPQKLVPADVARLVLWLAADDSVSCTGQKWIVDGGWM